LKILHFYKTSIKDSNGGTEQFMHQLILGGQKIGIEAEILTLSPDGKDDCDQSLGYNIYRIPRQFEIASNSISLAAFRKFTELGLNADIIHYHFPWPFMDVVHFLTRVNKPSVVTYHSDIVKQKKLLKLYSPLMYQFLNSVDKIIATSENYYRTSEILQKFKSKVSIVPIGIDENSYEPIEKEQLDYWRNLLGGNFYLFVGALRYYKGLHFLIEAACDSTWPIVIAGTGPIEKELKKIIVERKLNNIFLLGSVSEKDKAILYTLCRAVVFPSYLRSEAYGITLVEASMYSKPMITAEIGTGTSYVNLHNITGIVVPPNDSKSLKLALNQLWNNDLLCKQLGDNARKHYEENLTAVKMSELYSYVYRDLIHLKKKRLS